MSDDVATPADEHDTTVIVQDTRVLEIAHRYANILTNISALIREQTRQADSPEARMRLHFVGERVKLFSRLQLLLADPERASLYDYLDRAADLWREISGDGIMVRFEGRRDLDPTGATQDLAFIAHELVSNAIRHAFPDGRGTILVRMERCGPADARLRIIDDGVGVVRSSDGDGAARDTDGGGLGLVLVERLSRSCHSSVTLSQNQPQGTVATVDYWL